MNQFSFSDSNINISGGELYRSFLLDNLKNIYEISYGLAPNIGDYFMVFEFVDEVVILPGLDFHTSDLLALREKLACRKILYPVSILSVPWRWREKIWGFIPLFQEVAFSIRKKQSFPPRNWILEMAYSLDEYYDL